MSASKDAKLPEMCGPWTMERILGKGAFGLVKLWKNEETTEKIALKSCRWTLDDHELKPKHVERWKKEVEIMNKLDHLAVIKCFDVPPELAEANKGFPVLCMEYCPGGDLRKILNRSENCCGLREPDIRLCLSHVTGAISYLHSRGITHRDIKPENIVLNTIGQVVYKLIDLGYAKELETTSGVHSFVGTYAYLAPEFFVGERYTCTVDYWSLGLLTHEIITGSRPFGSPQEDWKLIEKKKNEDICAEKEKGVLHFRSQMVNEVHVSLPFKKRIEDWLKIMLTWNPKERGHIRKADGSTELAAFSMITDCLTKKVVKVFVVEKFNLLDYEVTETTSMRELQSWIERDTNIVIEKQQPLLPTGHSPNLKGPATQCWLPDVGEFLLYIFSETFNHPGIDPKIPLLTEKMIRSKTPFEYNMQKRMYAHSVFFFQRESRLLNLLTKAQKVYMLSLKMHSKRISQTEQQMNSGAIKLQARRDMFMEILDQHRTSYEELKDADIMSSPMLYKSWHTSQETILSKYESVMEKVQDMEGSLNAFQTKVLELQCSPFSNTQSKAPLADFVEKAENIYDSNRRQKEKRDTKPFLRLFKAAFTVRDRLHQELYQHISKQSLCLREANSLSKPLEDILEELARVGQLISHEQNQIQVKLWKIIEKTITSSQTIAGIASVPRNPPMAPAPTVSSQSLEKLLACSSKQSNALISENRDLRIRLISELSSNGDRQRPSAEKKNVQSSLTAQIPKVLGGETGVETSL